MSLQQIKVSREEALKIVKENKEKHDLVLKGAIEGYWIEAEGYLKKYEKDQIDLINKSHRDQLKKLRKARKEALKTLKTHTKKDLDRVKEKTRDKGFNYWNGKYPEDHGDDYLGTIRRLELCVDPEVELDNNEFDSYIRNKWTWRDSFLSSNRVYVASYATAYWGTGSCFGTSSYSLSPLYTNSSISGSYAISASWTSASYASF
jgi:hypothetical protein